MAQQPPAFRAGAWIDKEEVIEMTGDQMLRKYKESNAFRILARGTYHNWKWRITQDGENSERLMFIDGAPLMPPPEPPVPVPADVSDLSEWAESYMQGRGYGR